MKKLLVLLSLLVMPFALAGNKESVKEVKAEVDTNATITIGDNTFSRVTTSNMDKVKDGAKVILVTDNPTNGQLIVSSSRSGTNAPYGYTIENMDKNQYIFDVKSSSTGYELSMMVNTIEYKLYTPIKKSLSTFYLLDTDELEVKKSLTNAPDYSSEYMLTKGFYGDEENDYPVFAMDVSGENRTIQSYTNYSYSSTKQALTCFKNNTTKSKYGVASIYVLNEASELTNEEKATAFVNKWKAYDDNFCGNLKDETKRAEMSALIAEYDALDLEVKALVDAAIIKDGVTVANQIEYVRNSLAIKKSENTSQSLVNIITTNNSTMTYVLILSIATISLISYAFVLKTKKNK